MYCPVCSSQIEAMDVRCLNCNTLLIESSKREPTSQEDDKAAKKDDGIGKYAGFAGLAVGLYTGIFILLMMAGYYAAEWVGKRLLKSKAILYMNRH